MINDVNHQRAQEAVYKSLALPDYNADERTANCCGVSAAKVKQTARENGQGKYAKLKPYIYDKVRMPRPPRQRPYALSRSKFSP
jgi:hypothetical protein